MDALTELNAPPPPEFDAIRGSALMIAGALAMETDALLADESLSQETRAIRLEAVAETAQAHLAKLSRRADRMVARASGQSLYVTELADISENVRRSLAWLSTAIDRAMAS